MNTLGDGAQTGDISSRDQAGRDIYQGLSGEQLQALMQQQTEFYMTLVGAYERQYRDIGDQLRQLEQRQSREIEDVLLDIGIYREGERGQREARQKEIDARQKEADAHQVNLDRRLGRIEGAIVVLALILVILAWRLWPAITAVVALAAR